VSPDCGRIEVHYGMVRLSDVPPNGSGISGTITGKYAKNRGS